MEKEPCTKFCGVLVSCQEVIWTQCDQSLKSVFFYNLETSEFEIS